MTVHLVKEHAAADVTALVLVHIRVKYHINNTQTVRFMVVPKRFVTYIYRIINMFCWLLLRKKLNVNKWNCLKYVKYVNKTVTNWRKKKSFSTITSMLKIYELLSKLKILSKSYILKKIYRGQWCSPYKIIISLYFS